ncbi:LytR/AlgR family response regulator transcription factor [Pseudoalteromonas sp. T1lg65]|uniref:LytR/AlgR family response regulator transcription factor n=1 Tax=Pseudoalteromonas sp. T1lg65 TaxID=2077101 RepID=UPI003F7A72AF
MSTLGWTIAILFLTATQWLYNQIAADGETIDDPVWFALQEWGIWYLFTPITFYWLENQAKNGLLRWQTTCRISFIMYLVIMLVQAVFDYFFYQDAIVYTLYYFASTHLMVMFINVMIWHLFIHSPAKPKQVIETRPSCLLVDHGKDKTLVQQHNITHINAAGNYVEIHTTDAQFLKRCTLKQLAQHLATDKFIRTHRSHIVNVEYMERIKVKPSGNATVRLTSGAEVALSKAYKKQVRHQYQVKNLKQP